MDGDGLPDMVRRQSSTSWRVWRNIRNGFSSSYSDWAVSHANGYIEEFEGDDNDTESTLMDVNGDGLPDIVNPRSGTGLWDIYLNEGDSFGTKVQWSTIFTDGYTTEVKKDT